MTTTTSRPATGVGTRDYEGRYDIQRMIADAKTVIDQALINLPNAGTDLRVAVDTSFTMERAQDVVRVLNYMVNDPKSQAEAYTKQLLFYSTINQGEGAPIGITVTAKQADRFAIELRTVKSILESPVSAQAFVDRAIKAELKPSGAMVGA